MKKAFLLLFALPTLFFTSCEKDDNEDTCQTNMASMAGTYRVTAATYQLTATATPVDVLQIQFQPCQLDDTQTLNADGTWAYTDAGEQCGGNLSGTWSLSGNTLTLNGETATLTSFDCRAIVFSRADVLTSGDRINVTLTKQ